MATLLRHTSLIGTPEYHGYNRRGDLYRIVKDGNGYDVYVHARDDRFPLGRPTWPTDGELVNDFHLLRDAKEWVLTKLEEV